MHVYTKSQPRDCINVFLYSEEKPWKNKHFNNVREKLSEETPTCVVVQVTKLNEVC